jgi:hypothetical protein
MSNKNEKSVMGAHPHYFIWSTLRLNYAILCKYSSWSAGLAMSLTIRDPGRLGFIGRVNWGFSMNSAVCNNHIHSLVSLVESHLLVVRDVSKLDCKVYLKLRTFQIETAVETPLLVVTTRREVFRRTRRRACVDQYSPDFAHNNSPALPA